MGDDTDIVLCIDIQASVSQSQTVLFTVEECSPVNGLLQLV